MYRCSTPHPEPNAPCPNVCIDVQLHQNRTLLVPMYVLYRCSTPTPELNAPCPNVCIDVQLQHQNRTLLVPMYVLMFNSSTRTKRSLSQCMYRCSTRPPEPNAPCPNVCIDVQLQHQNRTLLVPMYVSMFNSSTRTERSLSQCMYRCSTPTPEPNAPCPNVCIDVQLLHQNRTLLDPMYVSMFNSSTRTERSLSQCMCCIDVQLQHHVGMLGIQSTQLLSLGRVNDREETNKQKIQSSSTVM